MRIIDKIEKIIDMFGVGKRNLSKKKYVIQY